MKIMENMVMVNVYMVRNTIISDSKIIEIAVDDCPNWFDDDVVEQWKKDLHDAVESHYNSYHYWDEISITREVFFRGEMHIVEL